MEPNTEENQNAAPDQNLPTEPTKLHQVNLGVVAVVLFLLLSCILGGLYYWHSLNQEVAPIGLTPTRPTPEMNNEPESTTAEAQVETLNALSTSDELDAIYADLEGTNLDTLEEDLLQVDAELDATFQQ